MIEGVLDMIVKRLLAILLLAVPAIIAMVGWNEMKNSVYMVMANEGFPFGKFILGAILFVVGVSFLAGFVFHRDRKRKLLQPRFMKKKKKKP